jgi:sulfopyruvate decarboxylase subunit beta
MGEARADRAGMDVVAALAALAEHCGDDAIVVTNQASARIWPQLRERPLDFHYNPSTMGGAIPFALGLALAQPARSVVVVSGDGALLMSLGSLVTAAAAGAENLTIVVLDNGLYEVTGGQLTAGACGRIDYAGIARGAGLATVCDFSDLDEWRTQAAGLWRLPGPRFVRLTVGRTPSEYLRFATPPLDSQLAALAQAIRGAAGSP